MAKFKAKAKRAGKTIKQGASNYAHTGTPGLKPKNAKAKAAIKKRNKKDNLKAMGTGAVAGAGLYAAAGPRFPGAGKKTNAAIRTAGAAAAVGGLAGQTKVVVGNSKYIKKNSVKVNARGGYTTYKKKTKGGKTITVKRKNAPKAIARKSAKKR